MNWEEIIRFAREMATKTPPDHLHHIWLRLSVSSAYYAMYHGFARSNADLLVGSSEAERNLPEWTRIYMALGDDTAAERAEGDYIGYGEDIRNFVEEFVLLSRQRLLAEQDPWVSYTADEALAWIDRAENAVIAFLSADAAQRRALALQVVAERQE